MTAVLASVDSSVYAGSVVEHAAWAAKRLALPVELLQVLGRREATSSDRSGRIVAGARRKLLEELAALDAERARLLQSDARLALEEARATLTDLGIETASIALRSGDLLEALDERAAETALLVVGKRGEAANFATLHLGSNLERIVRASERPILIAARAFRPIGRVLLAFDGGPSADKAVAELATSPLFEGLSITLLTVGEDTEKLATDQGRAAERLRRAGRDVTTEIRPGRPELVIARAVENAEIDLLVMGAYGHSRLRSLVIGSTTSALIRACQIPVAIYR
ncbi:MAG: universal stress protein [Pseudomonadota bacterium]